MKKVFILSLILIVCTAVSAQVSHAQTVPFGTDAVDTSFSGISGNDIDLQLTPESPEAFDTVTLRVSSDSVDLNRYPISWYINGNPTLSGVGERTYTVKIGNYGSRAQVQVAITLPNQVIQKGTVIAPQDITMLWEAADAYVPPFYQGKKLPAREGIVRVVAIPNFAVSGSKILPANTGVYIWKRNDKIVTGAGGYGKDSIMIQHNKLRNTETISVNASDLGQNVSGDKRIDLNFYDPQIHFYRKIYNQPDYSRALDRGFTMNSANMTLVAVPYFFSTSSPKLDGFTFNWKLNDDDLVVNDLKNPLTLNLTNPGNAGQSNLNLTIDGIDRIFQNTSRSLNVLYK